MRSQPNRVPGLSGSSADQSPVTHRLECDRTGVSVPEIAGKLTIKTIKNAGTSPSVASPYRAFAEAEEAEPVVLVVLVIGLLRHATPCFVIRPGMAALKYMC
ncbi:hypothetical protein [Streptomyces sp. DT171]|uniref:hypothetical protein n=1 Tax=Streptomyces sp. DT171 TaxID=3416524 RepID=UPI003CE9BF79